MPEEKKINVEIEEMLNALGDPTPEDIKEDEEDEDKDKEEDKDKDKEEEEEKEDPNKDKDKEDKEEDKDDLDKDKDEDDEETDKDKIIENLRKQINERPTTEEPKKEEPKKEEEKPPEPLKFEDQDFIGDIDLDDLTRDKSVLNKLLNTVYAKGVNDSKRIATEGVLNSIPDIVKHNLTLLTSLKEASDKFYDGNKDLIPFKRVVAAVFEEIASKNPDKKYSEIMDLVAPETRKRLELHKNAVKGKGNGKEEEEKSPRLPAKSGGQRRMPNKKPDTSSLASEIEEMNKTLGNRR